MLTLYYLFLFLLGLSVGSFLNVVIDRIPQGKSFIKGRSYCDYCRHQLAWSDLIPILSFLLLGSRCRYCRNSISWQYPLVELITGLLFVFAYSYSYSPEISLNQSLATLPLPPPSRSPFGHLEGVFIAYLFIIVSGLIVIFFIDLKNRIIPDQVLLLLLIVSLIYLVLFQSQMLLNHLLSGIILFIIFLALVVATRGKGMGLGDVKFSFIMGLLLGFPKIIVAFYLSFLTGAIFSLILVILGKKKMKSTIPFGPFLAVSTLIALFYGQDLWDFSKGLLGI